MPYEPRRLPRIYQLTSLADLLATATNLPAAHLAATARIAPFQPGPTPMSDQSPAPFADLEWDADGQPLSRQYGDVYFSRASGIAETSHVFLEPSRLAERLPASSAW